MFLHRKRALKNTVAINRPHVIRTGTLPRTNKYKCFCTEKTSPQKHRKSPTNHGQVAVTVLHFTCALLLREYIHLSRKKRDSFIVFSQKMVRQVCLPVFVILKQATPSKSGLSRRPATDTKSPSKSPHTGPLTLHKLAYTFPVPQYMAPS